MASLKDLIWCDWELLAESVHTCLGYLDICVLQYIKGFVFWMNTLLDNPPTPHSMVRDSSTSSTYQYVVVDYVVVIVFHNRQQYLHYGGG